MLSVPDNTHFPGGTLKWSGAGCILDFRAKAPAGLANMTQISERLLVQAHLDAKQPKQLTAEEEAYYRSAIAAELKAQDAVLVAHFYCDPVIQALAEETGGCVSDSSKWRASATLTRPRPWWSPA